MRSRFEDDPILDAVDDVGRFDGRQAMGDHDRRSTESNL